MDGVGRRHVLIAHYGENSPVDAGYRPQRYGQLARELVRRGHLVTRLLPQYQHLSAVKREDADGTEPGEGDTVHLRTPPYRASRGWSRLRFLRAYCAMLKRFAEQNGQDFDIVVVGCPPLKLAPAMRAFKRANPQVRLVVDVRDLWPDAQASTGGLVVRQTVKLTNPILRRRTKRALGLAGGVTAVSRAYLDWALAFRRLDDDVPSAVIPIGAVAPTATMAAHGRPGSGRPRAVFVGTLSAHFDFESLIAAWRWMVESEALGTTPELLIIGDGPAYESIAAVVSDTPTVQMLGRLLPADVGLCLESATIGVAPYAAGSMMSSTNKIAEYAAAGLPIVAGSRAVAVPRLVDDGFMRIVEDESTAGYARHLAEAFRLGADVEVQRRIRLVFDDELSGSVVSQRFTDLLLADDWDSTATIKQETAKMERFQRPTRGAVRLKQLNFDVSPLRSVLESMDASAWEKLNYGNDWAQVQLLKPDGTGGLERHQLMDVLPVLDTIIDAVPGECMDLSLARLGPNGAVKEHRDLSGGAPMGVARFHVPIVTSDAVEFQVSRNRVRMSAGQTWNLDTSYLHSVRNDSDHERIHLIGDFRLTDEVRAMLPSRDARDTAHSAYFFGVCILHGIKKLVTDPRAGVKRLRQFVALKVFRRSQLVFDD